MSKVSKLVFVAAIAASAATPALAQTPGEGFYNYSAPGPAWSYYSDHPAATGGGSWGYNEQVRKDDW